jgi:hypothetical protein
MKAALACMALLCVSATIPNDQARTVNYPLVHQVLCEDGSLRGSAFRVGESEFITAAHVAANLGCTIDGEKIEIEAIKGETDFAEIRSGKAKGGKFDIDCGGFIPGHWYFAVGYAYGAPTQTLTPVYATARFHKSGLRALLGTQFIRGMSGGVVFDEFGKAVGIVNALILGTDWSLSRELKDTPLCQS